MTKKKYYVVLNQKSRRLMGCFERNSEGRKLAKAYKKKIEKTTKSKCVIK